MTLTLEQLDWLDPNHPRRLPEVEILKEKTFVGQKVVVDNRHFQKCRFEHCNFVYSGGPFAFYECEIRDYTVFSPTGSANRTMKLVEALKPGFGKGLPPY
jgi:hypothetical protein